MINYVDGVEIKMTTKDMGRGVFATRDIKKGDFIIVEKSLNYN